jgi:phosphotransacetylase
VSTVTAKDSSSSAQAKGISSSVAGHADIPVVPDIEQGLALAEIFSYPHVFVLNGTSAARAKSAEYLQQVND